MLTVENRMSLKDVNLKGHCLLRSLPPPTLSFSKEVSVVCYSAFSFSIIFQGVHQPHSQNSYLDLLCFLNLFLCKAWPLCPSPILFRDSIKFWNFQVLNEIFIGIFSSFIYNKMRMRFLRLSPLWPSLWAKTTCLNWTSCLEIYNH